MQFEELQEFLNRQVDRFNQASFIENDPISIPHQFNKLQDIEISGFWTAMLAWGQRPTIIKKAKTLIELMDGAPYDFIINHQESDRKRFTSFKHRTFQAIDALYFLEFFSNYYKKYDSLEEAFANRHSPELESIEQGIIDFQKIFFSYNPPRRTMKHVASPARNSTCKRINMFLRWMVRKDNNKVDFGLWKKISPSQLLIPLDTHVDKVARRYGLLKRKQSDWKSVIKLTRRLKQFDPDDPIKYDYALFGIGILQYDDMKS